MTNKIILLLGVVLILTSCNKSKDLKNAIPADANYVVYVDAESLVKKSQYDIFNNSVVQQGLTIYKAMLKDDKAIKLFDAFLKDANAFGVNLKGETYFYTNYKTYGVVLGVNDAEKIKEALLSFKLATNEEITQKDGIYMMDRQPQTVLAWDSQKLVLLVDIQSAYQTADTATNNPNLAELAQAQLKQGADKSINSNPQFVDFFKKKKDVSIFFSMKGMDKTLDDISGLAQVTDATIPFKKLLADVEGLSSGAYISFEKGEIQMENTYFFDSPESEKKYKDLLAQLTNGIKGDQLKYITSDPLFLISTNLKGQGTYDYLKKIGIFDMISKQQSEDISIEEIEKILKDVNGDVTLAVGGKVPSKTQSVDPLDEGFGTPTPQMVLFADLTNPAEVLNFIKLKLDEKKSKYTLVSATEFKLTKDNNVTTYWGAIGNMFFVTNDQVVYDNLKATNLTNRYADVIKGKSSVMLGDLKIAQSYIADNATFASAGTLLNEFGQYQYSVGSDLVGNGKLELATKDKNSLAVICERIDQLITNLAGAFR